jgi:hypothetical protein
LTYNGRDQVVYIATRFLIAAAAVVVVVRINRGVGGGREERLLVRFRGLAISSIAVLVGVFIAGLLLLLLRQRGVL